MKDKKQSRKGKVYSTKTGEEIKGWEKEDRRPTENGLKKVAGEKPFDIADWREQYKQAIDTFEFETVAAVVKALKIEMEFTNSAGEKVKGIPTLAKLRQIGTEMLIIVAQATEKEASVNTGSFYANKMDGQLYLFFSLEVEVSSLPLGANEGE